MDGAELVEPCRAGCSGCCTMTMEQPCRQLCCTCQYLQKAVTLSNLQGKITSYSPQSGKFTVKYDDGQSEQVMLERERFVWHSPRGLSAGYRTALHSLMQQLGAEGLQPEPQMGVDGVVIPEVKGPEVRNKTGVARLYS